MPFMHELFKTTPLTFAQHSAILGTYFGRALAAVCGVGRTATIEHEGDTADRS